jgi:hypothetical protein
MFSAGICPEREKLLRTATAAVTHHNKTVTDISRILAERGRKPDAQAFAVFQDEVSTSFATALTAWDEYRKHVHEHGCSV